MPKDPARNIDSYQISGDKLNEFEFEKNQEEMTSQQRDHFARKEEERDLRNREDEQSREVEGKTSE
jgi:hypothetical protein